MDQADMRATTNEFGMPSSPLPNENGKKRKDEHFSSLTSFLPGNSRLDTFIDYVF